MNAQRPRALTQEIYNYRKVNEHLITCGQPTEEQLKAAAEEGFKVVINLATISSRYSLPDEEGLVRSLGMTYHHFPVDWENPKTGDFDAFENLLESLPEEKILIHCAANYRVTAFYSLFAMKHLRWSSAEAEAFRASIWEGSDYPVWVRFISQMEASLSQADPE
jgi:protein tyrosine phosphatase (PTP) superfamily phosphohydrolase (DUF442 family)